MATALELAKDPFSRHFALEVLYSPLDATVSNLDLDGLTLNRFDVRHQTFAHNLRTILKRREWARKLSYPAHARK